MHAPAPVLEGFRQAMPDFRHEVADVNVLGSVRVTKALLPQLDASGRGTIVMMSSTAGLIVYEGGGGYAAAKHAQTAVAETLRLELCGRPVLVIGTHFAGATAGHIVRDGETYRLAV